MLFALFALLLAASALLAVEVAARNATPEAGPRRWLRIGVFALAAAAGGTLLVALPLSEWVLILALVPLTSISLIRAWTLVSTSLPGWRGMALVTAAVLMAVAVGVQTVPIPLTRDHIQSALPGGPPPSAHPDAGRLVRT